MSLRAVLCFTVLLSAVSARAASVPIDQNADVTGAWSFEQSPADASLYGHQGAFIGQPQWGFGNFGWFARFGNTSHLRVPSHPVLEPQMITVEGWIRHDGHPGHYQYILAKGARSGCNSATYALNTETSGGLRVRLGNHRLGADRASIDVAEDPSFVEGGCAGPGCRALWDGQWHHVAFTADGRHLRFYVDGTIVRRADGVQAAPLHGYALGYDMPGHNDLTIGAYAGDCHLPYAGAADEFRVWRRVLSDDEIAARRDGQELAEETCAPARTTPVAAPDVAGAWNFNEAPHEDVADSSPHALHGIAGSTSGRDDADPFKLCGKEGQAARFHGMHSVRIPYDPRLEPQELSLEMWFRHDLRDGEQKVSGYVISKGGSAGCDFPSFTFTGVTGEGLQFGIRDEHRAYVSPAASDAVLYDGQWHHLVGTYDRHTLRLYVDGVESGSGRAAENVDIFYALTGHRDLTIGKLENGSCTMHVSADLDGVRLWSRALTPEQVAAIFVDAPPQCATEAVLGAIAPVAEGTAVTLPLTTNADSVEIAWGDGTTTSSLSHAYADDGVYTVTVTAAGAAGCSATATAEVIVTNAAPVITSASAGPSPRPVGTAIDGRVTFSDAGAADTHQTLWSWGDGATGAQPSHVYTAAGVYPVSVTVTDDDGASAQAAAGTVVVYDPAAGRLTGGGWIASGSGPVHFTVQAKYAGGSSVPEGNLQLRIGTAAVRFTADAYEWLVVNGPQAQLRGTGRLGNSGGFSFLLTALDDGHSDRLGIRIWNTATGAVVHDSGNTPVPLSGGDLQLHR